ncbi:MAG: hypothetical protein HYS04_14850 [Acidobacteria bacterium]|nr:hypothetical protein [Acidobacteriota bacterium]
MVHLPGILSLFLAAGLALAQSQSSNTTKNLSLEELEQLLARKDKVVFLDVREPHELEQLGTLEGHINIPLGQLEARLKELPKDKLIITL